MRIQGKSTFTVATRLLIFWAAGGLGHAALIEQFTSPDLDGQPGSVFTCMGKILNSGPDILEIAQGNYSSIPGVRVLFLLPQGAYETLMPGQQYAGPIAKVELMASAAPGVYDFTAYPSYVSKATGDPVFPNPVPTLKLVVEPPQLPEPGAWILVLSGIVLFGAGHVIGFVRGISITMRETRRRMERESLRRIDDAAIRIDMGIEKEFQMRRAGLL